MGLPFGSSKKITALVIGLVVLMGVVSGCTGSKSEQVPPTPPSPREQVISLPVYYVKPTGEETYLVREVHRLPATGEPAVAAVQELISGTPTTPGATPIFPQNTRVLGVTVKDGLATVNFSREVLEQTAVGSEGEALALQSVVNTLTEFPEIRAVSLQVEGQVDERTRDWWGHVGLYSQPFRRDLSRVYEPAIWVSHPIPGQVAAVPLLVRGSARVFEGNINARLLDGQGNVLARGTASASKNAPDRGDFELRLNFTPPGQGEGLLEVFSINPRNGSEENLVKVNVKWP